MKAVLGLALAALLAAPAHAASASARLIGLDGKEVGKATFRSTPHGVLIELNLRGLPPGPHAVMIHMTGVCEPNKTFATAGPDLSFDPSRPHGYLAKGGPRPGDLPNQFAAADGTLRATIYTTAFTLGDGAKSIFDRDGASIVVNARGDNYMSQPDGDAGARIACGVIGRTAGPGSRRGSAHRKHR
jgi:superoxide dismutase, Cu-Zn family